MLLSPMKRGSREQRTADNEVSPMTRADDGTSGLTITEADGQQYFVFGKNRIKIVEHFPQHGKTMDELIAVLIHNKIRTESQKTA